jgi:hypothetical protein
MVAVPLIPSPTPAWAGPTKAPEPAMIKIIATVLHRYFRLMAVASMCILASVILFAALPAQ